MGTDVPLRGAAISQLEARPASPWNWYTKQLLKDFRDFLCQAISSWHGQLAPLLFDLLFISTLSRPVFRSF